MSLRENAPENGSRLLHFRTQEGLPVAPSLGVRMLCSIRTGEGLELPPVRSIVVDSLSRRRMAGGGCEEARYISDIQIVLNTHAGLRRSRSNSGCPGLGDGVSSDDIAEENDHQGSRGACESIGGRESWHCVATKGLSGSLSKKLCLLVGLSRCA